MTQESYAEHHDYEPSGHHRIVTEQHELVRTRMSKFQHKIAVISGKGGVGKTVVTVNLAMAFAKHGIFRRVGILDADIHGPCVPKMLGLKGQNRSIEDA